MRVPRIPLWVTTFCFGVLLGMGAWRSMLIAAVTGIVLGALLIAVSEWDARAERRRRP